MASTGSKLTKGESVRSDWAGDRTVKDGRANFKVLLYTELKEILGVSGLGKAILHQKQALEQNGIPYTLDKNDNYDIAHINYYGPRSYRLAKKARRQGRKVAYHAHSTKEDFLNSFIFSNQLAPLFKWWICKCYQLGDVIVTPTEYAKKLLEGYGLKNIRVVSNGVDMEFFQKDAELGAKFRRKYGFSEKDKVVMGIGLYLKRKGILDFVELARRMPEYQFIWFGETNRAIIPHEIRKAVKTKLPNLKFPGHVPAEEIKAALSGADLYIFPTFEETEGIPILEAMACKQRILVRDIPCFRWVTNEAYKARSLNGFEQKIRQILEGQLPDLTANGRRTVMKYDVKKVGRELVEVYREVMGASGVDVAGATSGASGERMKKEPR